MCLIDLLFLSLTLGIFECLRTVTFDTVLLNVVVAVLAVDAVIHIGLDLTLDFLLLGSLYIGAVVLLGGFDQRFGDADANSFLEIGKEILFGILRFLGDNGVDHGIKFVVDIAIHFVPEQILGLADDLLIRNGHFAVLIEIEFIGGSCLDSEVFSRSLVRFQLLQGLNHFGRSMEDVADVLEQEITHEAAAHNLARVDLAWDREHLFGVQLHHFAVFVFADYGEEVQQPTHVLFA